jgi:hypothetical protein
MNDMAIRTSSPCAPVLGIEPTLTVQTRWRLAEIMEPLAPPLIRRRSDDDEDRPRERRAMAPRRVTPPAVREEAERTLARIGPLLTIGLVDFHDWIKPFFTAAGARAVSEADQRKHIGALYDLVSDMPAEVFTPENRRAVAKLSEFVPTAARIHSVMGEQAARVVAMHKALITLIERAEGAAPPALPLPEPPTPAQIEAERLARRLHVDRVMGEHRAWQAERAAQAPTAPAFGPTPPSAEHLAALRVNNPIVQAAFAQAAKEKG